jgi:hypothetical protein
MVCQTRAREMAVVEQWWKLCAASWKSCLCASTSHVGQAASYADHNRWKKWSSARFQYRQAVVGMRAEQYVRVKAGRTGKVAYQRAARGFRHKSWALAIVNNDSWTISRALAGIISKHPARTTLEPAREGPPCHHSPIISHLPTPPSSETREKRNTNDSGACVPVPMLTGEDAALRAIATLEELSAEQQEALKAVDTIIHNGEPFVDVHELLAHYNILYFRKLLLPRVEVLWSPRLTL